ncbi:hypothetical protein BpHYR1_046971 [Brachionus plicatilis]|uniref:Uncharacterized protein n=1 Tax=Brachionus plicatilis TaxID=10195 RepID=A0A3M7SDN1_BRAPC|nr:hypothetical protein BpHYR1_046971 [Brachionus plicatilis]
METNVKNIQHYLYLLSYTLIAFLITKQNGEEFVFNLYSKFTTTLQKYKRMVNLVINILKNLIPFSICKLMKNEKFLKVHIIYTNKIEFLIFRYIYKLPYKTMYRKEII